MRARGAGADERRHRAPAAGLPRRPARADAAGRDAAGRGRDAYALRRAWRYTREHRLDPDLLTVGKAIGSGVASAAYGFTAEVAERVEAAIDRDRSDVGGVGGTLAANVLSLAAMRATLEHVLKAEAFARMVALAERFERGVQDDRGILLTPFHAMALMSPATSEADVDLHTAVVGDAVSELTAPS